MNEYDDIIDFDQHLSKTSSDGETRRGLSSSPSSSSSSSHGELLPLPRAVVQRRDGAVGSVSIRVAEIDRDYEFIDSLQKMHTHMVGWMPHMQLRNYIEKGYVLVAEDGQRQVGYCIARDQYFKRDDVGIVYQLNVSPMVQRHFVGAALLQAVFDRAAYGCRLFCCWCAQDIQANYFWEAMGFVPLAFRTGSRLKQRIHIFWQKRIREGDEGPNATPWWYPYMTQNGAVREDRLVFPIPPETHWRDAKPVILPGAPELEGEDGSDIVRGGGGGGHDAHGQKLLPGGAAVRPRPEQPKLTAAQRAVIKRMQSKHLGGVPLGKKAVMTSSGIKYVPRDDYVEELDGQDELLEELAGGGAAKKKKSAPKPKKERSAAQKKHDAKLMAGARDLRDKYLELVNAGRVLPAGWGGGKYEVVRVLEGGGGGGGVGGGGYVRVDDGVKYLESDAEHDV
ncbi:MAG: GNAT family N-acetyltransferase [Phycisphaerales bacterium]